MNGIVFIKGYYSPNYSIVDPIQKLLESNNVLLQPIERNVVVKKFGNPNSKGCQIYSMLGSNETTKNSIISFIKNIVETTISIFFFLYDKSNYKAGERTNLFEIKKKEMEIMKNAIAGEPSERFQIPIIEKTIDDVQRKRTIYQQIYKTEL
jgi:hypothetical protein